MTIRLAEVNFVLISGRLTRDADVRMTQKGQTVCGFSVAVNRRYMDNASGEWKEEVSYVNVSYFGQSADRVKDRLKKGVPVMVEGRLNMNEYTTKDGQPRREIRVVANRVQVLQSMGDGSFNPEASASPAADNSPAEEDDVPF